MPTPPEPITEARLAWLIWHALVKLNDLLWDHYKKDFLSFAKEDQNPTEDDDTPPEF